MGVHWGVYIFAIALQYIHRKTSQRSKLIEPWEDLSFPEADLGSPIPVVFGTRRLNNANVVWYGDLRTRPVRVQEGGKK